MRKTARFLYAWILGPYSRNEKNGRFLRGKTAADGVLQVFYNFVFCLLFGMINNIIAIAKSVY